MADKVQQRDLRVTAEAISKAGDDNYEVRQACNAHRRAEGLRALFTDRNAKLSQRLARLLPGYLGLKLVTSQSGLTPWANEAIKAEDVHNHITQ